MRYRYRQGVGCVVGLGDVRHPQQDTHHFLYLLLICTSIPGYCLFDLIWRVLGDLQAGFSQCQQRHPARLPNREGCFHIVLKKQLLHRSRLGAMEKQKLA